MAKAKVKTKKKTKAKIAPRAKVKVKAKPKPKRKAHAKTKVHAKTKTNTKKAVKAPALSLVSKQTVTVQQVAKFVTPLDDRLIVQVVQGEKRTAGGLYIPDSVETSTGNNTGTVLAVGRGHRDNKGRVRPMDVKVGDQVLFSSYAGSKLNLSGVELTILRESELMGVMS